MKRKVISILLVCMLLFSVASPAFAADFDMILSDVTNGVKGETVTVKLTFADMANPGIYAANFYVKYDKTQMTYKGAKATGTLAVASAVNTQVGDQCMILVKNSTKGNYNAGGTVAELTFELKANAKGGTYEIELLGIGKRAVAVDYSGSEVKPEFTNGVVTIEKSVYNVSLPTNTTNYTVTGDATVTEGNDYTFTVKANDGYVLGTSFTQSGSYGVKANGEYLYPPNQGASATEESYTIPASKITGDLTIAVSGIEVKAEEPAFTPGDVDNSGDITNKDYLLLRKYLLGAEVEINLNAADFDGEDGVTNKDYLLLRKHLLSNI